MTTVTNIAIPAARAESTRAGTAVTIGRLVWVVAILLAVVFFVHAGMRFFVLTEASYRVFWPNRYWLLLHFIGGSTALLSALPQFCAGLRRRYPAVHRWTGRLYLAGVGVGAVAAFYLSFHSVVGWTFGVATFFLCVAWVVTTAMALVPICRGDVQAHREWMIRSYVVTFAFVAFRLLAMSPLFAGTGSFLERYTTLLWMSWTVPLLITETVLQFCRPSVSAVKLARSRY